MAPPPAHPPPHITCRGPPDPSALAFSTLTRVSYFNDINTSSPSTDSPPPPTRPCPRPHQPSPTTPAPAAASLPPSPRPPEPEVAACAPAAGAAWLCPAGWFDEGGVVRLGATPPPSPNCTVGGSVSVMSKAMPCFGYAAGRSGMRAPNRSAMRRRPGRSPSWGGQRGWVGREEGGGVWGGTDLGFGVGEVSGEEQGGREGARRERGRKDGVWVGDVGIQKGMGREADEIKGRFKGRCIT